MTEHVGYSPGLWIKDDDDIYTDSLPDLDVGNLVCLAPDMYPPSMKYWKANANLIAAAPELLVALEELADLMDALREGEYEPDSLTTQPARLAIAKAKGLHNA